MRKRNPGVAARPRSSSSTRRSCERNPDRDAVRREALAACLKLGRYSDAVTHAEALLKTFPNEAVLWQQLGAAQAGLNQLAGGEGVLREGRDARARRNARLPAARAAAAGGT